MAIPDWVGWAMAGQDSPVNSLLAYIDQGVDLEDAALGAAAGATQTAVAVLDYWGVTDLRQLDDGSG